jgi:hypothetical protein
MYAWKREYEGFGRGGGAENEATCCFVRVTRGKPNVVNAFVRSSVALEL